MRRIQQVPIVASNRVIRERPYARVLWAGGFVLLGSSAFALSLVGLSPFGITYNETPSEPFGFYREQPFQTPRVGEIVRFCPDPSWPLIRLAERHHWMVPGNCPGGFAPFVKTIEGLPGQWVRESTSGVCVADTNAGPWRCLPHSAPTPTSWSGKTDLRPYHYPFGLHRIPAGKVWLYGTLSRWSMDSRYYGPVSLQRVRQSLVPVWTWR